MAKLRSPINQIQKNGLRGQVDFCYWKGIPYARSWPRKSNLNPTPKQQYYRDLMAASNARITAQPELQRLAWRTTCHQQGATWVDYFKRMHFALDKTGDNQQMPYFTTMSALYSFSEPTLRVYANWDPGKQPAIQPFQIYWRAAKPGEVAVQWVYSGMSQADGRKTVKFYEMDMHNFKALKPSSFDQANGRAIFEIPFSVISGVFVAGQKVDQTNTSYVQTPVYFLEPHIDFGIDCREHISNGPPEEPRFFLQVGGRYEIQPTGGYWYTPLWQGADPKYNRHYSGTDFSNMKKPCFTGMISQGGEWEMLPGTTEIGFDSPGWVEYYYEKFWDDAPSFFLKPGPVWLWYQDDYVYDNDGRVQFQMNSTRHPYDQIIPDYDIIV